MIFHGLKTTQKHVPVCVWFSDALEVAQEYTPFSSSGHSLWKLHKNRHAFENAYCEMLSPKMSWHDTLHVCHRFAITDLYWMLFLYLMCSQNNKWPHVMLPLGVAKISSFSCSRLFFLFIENPTCMFLSWNLTYSFVFHINILARFSL